MGATPKQILLIAESPIIAKKTKTTFIFFTFVISLIVCSLLFINNYLSPLLKNKIIELVNSSNGNFYNLQVKDVDVNLFNGGVAIKNVQLTTNPEKLQELKRENLPKVSVNSKSIVLTNFKWWNYLKKKELSFNKISIESPQVSLCSFAGDDDSSNNKDVSKDFVHLIPKIFGQHIGSVQIDEINVTSGAMEYIKEGKQKATIQIAKKIDLEFNNIKIDDSSIDKVLSYDDINFSIKGYKYFFHNKDNFLFIGETHGSISDSILHVKDIVLRENSEELKDNTWLNTNIKKASLEGVDFKNLLYNKGLFVNSFSIDSPILNYGYTPSGELINKNKKEQLISSLRSLLNNFYNPIRANTLSINNGQARFTRSNKEGKIEQTAEGVSINIHNISLDTLAENILSSQPKIDFNISNYKVITSDKSNDLIVKKISGSYPASTLRLENLKYEYKNIDNKNDFFNLNLKKVETIGIDYLGILDNNVSAQKILIERPAINVQTHGSSESVKLPLGIESFDIKNVEIKDAAIEHKAINEKTQSANAVNVKVKGLKIDHVIDGINFFRNINFEMSNYKIQDFEQNVYAKSAYIKLSQEKGTAECKDIFVEPLNSYKYPFQKFAFKSHLGNVYANGFDVLGFLNKKDIKADKIDVNHLSFKLDKKAISESETGASSNMPQDWIKKFKNYLLFKKINIADANIHYTSKEAGQTTPSILNFEHANLFFRNITNDPNLMTNNSPAYLYGKCQLMGKGELVLSISSHLLAKKLEGKYSGSLSNIEGSEFNSWLTSTGYKVKRGTIDKMTFESQIINGSAKGKFKMLYHDLKINSINPKTGKVKKISTFFTNIFVKKKNIERKGRSGEVVNIATEPEDNDNFFYFLWRPLRDGMVETITKDFYVVSEY